jgi:hypothetical protein
VALLASATLWAWPLLYLSTSNECGADIGIGIFGVPLTLLGVGAGIAVGVASRLDALTVSLGAVGALAGVLSLLGLFAELPPYDTWYDYAVDAWYHCAGVEPYRWVAADIGL